MEQFLRTVARHYKNKSCSEAQLNRELASLPLSRYLFCFPNRRSGLFFARYLREEFAGPCCVPPQTTINELFSLFSTRHVLDRTSLLFKLFSIYDQLSKRRDHETFDQFVFWGDMLLSDFEDVDKYLVNADQLFANVKDLKEIESRFSGFEPEQIEVIKSFWRSFNPDKNYLEGDKHEVFGQTWAILGDLYHTFRKSLFEQNQAYEGMLEREVVELLESKNRENEDLFASLPYQKVVFVGLTAVSKTERKLMSLLKVAGLAEFCWDYADPRLKSPDSKATSAAYFSQSNLNDFSNEISDEELVKGLVPENSRNISLYSISSGVGQTQQARSILLNWQKNITDFDPFKTAVVLPDEKLLLPMLYAVPPLDENGCGFDSFNVTMGYSLRDTPITAFVKHLAALQQAWKESSHSFYYHQVLPILSHNYTLGLCGQKAREMISSISAQNLYQIPIEYFAEDEFLRLVFTPLRSSIETINYLESILDLLMKRAAEDIKLHDSENEVENSAQLMFDFFDEKGNTIFTDTDYEFLYHYRKTVSGLEEELKESHLDFTPKTFFQLLDKLISGVSVPFSGEPLKGLQIMGVLETRALDFDNVIILSMNEGVFPAKPSQNTFVPMSLRDAFGMPTQRHRDSVFAYHFYRLISRASNLALVYDSRTEGIQTGEESRYIKQLRYLMGHDDLKAQTTSSNISVISSVPIQINKSEDVLKQLNLCTLPDSGKFLSASSLKYYIQCPLKFYLSFVRGLHEDDEVSEGVDAALFGNILHEAMRIIYSHCFPREVQSSMIEDYLKNVKDLEHVIRQSFTIAIEKDKAEECKKQGLEIPEYNLEGYNLLISQIITFYIKAALKHDQSLCPFTYLAAEQRQKVRFQVNDHLSVNIKCIYDRLDRLSNSDTVRIVDYKTGSPSLGNYSKLVFPSVDDLFHEGSKGSNEAFQVMLYCLLLELASQSDLKEMNLDRIPQKIMPNLYFVRDFCKNIKSPTVLTLKEGKDDSSPIVDFTPLRKDFKEHLIALLTEIFDPEVPFKQCADTKICSSCPFTNLCKRI